MRAAVFVGLGVTAAAAFVAAACSSATGIDACQQIEQARCYWIEQCESDAGNFGLPTRRSDSTSPVDDCFRFYSDACQHGLVTNVPPTSDQVSACVAAINAATDCTIVQNPETADACAWLTVYDAGPDADGATE